MTGQRVGSGRGSEWATLEQALASWTGSPDTALRSVSWHDVPRSSGVATRRVQQADCELLVGGRSTDASVIVKELAPVTTGRHAQAASNPTHWAYWRREILAYESGVLPRGRGLCAPQLIGVAGDTLYLESVPRTSVQPVDAARHLAMWQPRMDSEHSWLAEPQLAQRIHTTDESGGLDWTLVPDAELAELWSRRHELLSLLNRLPRVVCHGDFSAGNLFSPDDQTTYVIDWGQLGWGPPGADLASLALTCDPLPDATLLDSYLAALDASIPAMAARLGFAVSAVLVGVSRFHWMNTNGVSPQSGYRQWLLERAGECLPSIGM